MEEQRFEPIPVGESQFYDPVDDEIYDDPNAIVVYSRGSRLVIGRADSMPDRDDLSPPLISSSPEA